MLLPDHQRGTTQWQGFRLFQRVYNLIWFHVKSFKISSDSTWMSKRNLQPRWAECPSSRGVERGGRGWIFHTWTCSTRLNLERNWLPMFGGFISNKYGAFPFLSGFSVFSIHLMARSRAAASSAMRAEYPPAASRNGRTTLRGCSLVGRTRYKVLHRSDGEYPSITSRHDKLSSLPSSDPLQNHFKNNCCRLW